MKLLQAITQVTNTMNNNQLQNPQEPPPPPPPPPPLSSSQYSSASDSPTSQNEKTYKLTAVSICYAKPTNQAASLLNCLLPITTTCKGGAVKPPPNFILNQVSFTAHPGQLLAVVGPSGAGKSTLLDILAARTAPTLGSLLLNSSPQHPSTFRKLTAYVPQEDACLAQLTVSETFTYTARLLYPDRSSSDLRALVLSLLTDLGLSHVIDARVSLGLSGGERRRVSIGVCLLHNPAILLLDEPTSGLDSRSAFHILQTLKSIATSRGRTVVLSIHQPSYRILSVIDSLLLLSRGRVVHHGDLSSLHMFLLSRGFTIPPQLNPLEFTMEVLAHLAIHDQSSKIGAATDHLLPPNININLKASSTCKDQIVKEPPPDCFYSSSRLNEIKVLFLRFLKIVYRTRQLLVTNTAEALVVGFVLGTIYINIGTGKEGIEKRLGLFAFTLTFLLSSTTETLPIFVGERIVLLREVSGGTYRLSSHLIANTLVFLPYLLMISLLFSLSLYFLVGLCSSLGAFLYFLLVIWIIVLMANSFVLFVSSLAPNYIAGTSLVTTCLGGFFLFSGYFISKGSIPGYWLFMHYLSPYKYALDALLLNEYSCRASTCFLWLEEGAVCAVTGRDVMEARGLNEKQRWMNVEVMVGFFVLYRLLCLLVLSRRASSSEK